MSQFSDLIQFGHYVESSTATGIMATSRIRSTRKSRGMENPPASRMEMQTNVARDPQWDGLQD